MYTSRNTNQRFLDIYTTEESMHDIAGNVKSVLRRLTNVTGLRESLRAGVDTKPYHVIPYDVQGGHIHMYRYLTTRDHDIAIVTYPHIYLREIDLSRGVEFLMRHLCYERPGVDTITASVAGSWNFQFKAAIPNKQELGEEGREALNPYYHMLVAAINSFASGDLRYLASRQYRGFTYIQGKVREGITLSYSEVC